jgi:hypothetical protein
MLFCFTATKQPLSRAVRWGLGEDCSHFALVFDERPEGYGLVLHSDLMGVRLCWWNEFQKTHQLVHVLRPKYSLSLQQEESFYRAVISRFYGQPYDFRAFAYWAYCMALKKMANRPIPPVNAWGEPNAFLCTALAQALRDPVFQILKLNTLHTLPDFEMVSPHQLFLALCKSPVLEVCQWKNCAQSSSEVSPP